MSINVHSQRDMSLRSPLRLCLVQLHALMARWHEMAALALAPVSTPATRHFVVIPLRLTSVLITLPSRHHQLSSAAMDLPIQLGIIGLLSITGAYVTWKTIPQMRQMFIKSNLFGIDLCKNDRNQKV